VLLLALLRCPSIEAAAEFLGLPVQLMRREMARYHLVEPPRSYAATRDL
jgi:hypothetical protein